MKCSKCGSDLPNDSEICQYCGNRLASATVEMTPGAGIRQIFPWAVAVLAVLCLCLSLYQNSSLKGDNAQLQNRLLILEEENGKLKDEVYTQQTEASSLKDKAARYDHICESLENSDIGYAAYHFRSYESVIVVNKNDKDRKFTLVASCDEDASVHVSYSSPAATVSFDETGWEESTTMTVHPKSVGATVVTFTNSADSNRFKILILVTE